MSDWTITPWVRVDAPELDPEAVSALIDLPGEGYVRHENNRGREIPALWVWQGEARKLGLTSQLEQILPALEGNGEQLAQVLSNREATLTVLMEVRLVLEMFADAEAPSGFSVATVPVTDLSATPQTMARLANVGAELTVSIVPETGRVVG